MMCNQKLGPFFQLSIIFQQAATQSPQRYITKAKSHAIVSQTKVQVSWRYSSSCLEVKLFSFVFWVQTRQLKWQNANENMDECKFEIHYYVSNSSSWHGGFDPQEQLLFSLWSSFFWAPAIHAISYLVCSQNAFASTVSIDEERKDRRLFVFPGAQKERWGVSSHHSADRTEASCCCFPFFSNTQTHLTGASVTHTWELFWEV